MLINNSTAISRLTSPGNLINKLRAGISSSSSNPSKNRAMSLFGVGSQSKKEESPSFIPRFSSSAQSTQEAQEPTTVITPEVIAANINLPTIDNLVDSAADRIKMQQIHSAAVDTMLLSINKLKDEVDNVRPDKLVAIATGMSKIVDSINSNNKGGKDKEVHLHFYTPERKKMTDYQEVTV